MDVFYVSKGETVKYLSRLTGWDLKYNRSLSKRKGETYYSISSDFSPKLTKGQYDYIVDLIGRCDGYPIVKMVFKKIVGSLKEEEKIPKGEVEKRYSIVKGFSLDISEYEKESLHNQTVELLRKIYTKQIK